MADRRRNLDIFRGFPIWLPGIIQDSIVFTRDHSDPKCVGKSGHESGLEAYDGPTTLS
jgi:hypothetical protein